MLTIPAACLEAIGGLADDDPPVLAALDWGGGFVGAHHPLVSLMRDGTMEQTECQRLILPQSAPAILRCIARHVGMTLAEGEVPRFGWESGAMWLESAAGRRERVRPATGLSPDMTHMHAFAEVVVHLARVEGEP